MLAYNQCFPERQVKGAVFPLIESERIGPLAQRAARSASAGQVDTVDTLSTSSNRLDRPDFWGQQVKYKPKALSRKKIKQQPWVRPAIEAEPTREMRRRHPHGLSTNRSR